MINTSWKQPHRFYDEMMERSEAMKQMKNYKTGENYAYLGLPAHFLIFDEYVAFMEMLGTKENTAVLNKLKQIVMLGRQAGFFLILACQRPDAKYLGDGIRDQFNFRVALGRMSEMGYGMMFGSDVSLFAVMILGNLPPLSMIEGAFLKYFGIPVAFTWFMSTKTFIAYAPDYIGKINDFSSDISNASLSLGTKIVMPHSNSQGKDSVDLIRDSLFSTQVQQPWLLLQYNNSDMESIGVDRVENLLSTSPDSNNGKDRETVVVEEIENRNNTNLTITKTINRLGTVFFLFVFNIGISIFVFLLTGIMIFSQVLFIIYAMFLPVSFILSMIPSFDGMSKRAITKLFNTILTRAGITLIITTAFSISTMLYTLSAGYPFFLIAFLQIVTFAGIYFKLGDLMSMFSLQSNDSQSVGSRVMRKPRMLMHAHMHRLQRKLGRSMTTLGAGSAIVTGKKGQSGSGSSARTQADHSRPDGKEKSTLGKRIGQTIGTVADTKDRMVDTASGLKEQVKDLPTNARYAVYQGKSKVKENVRDLTSSISQTKADRASGRKEQQEQRRKTIAKRRSEMEQVKQKKQPASSVHERPTTRQEQYHDEQTSKQSNIQTSYKESQQAKQERPAVKSDFSSPKVERQGNTVQEKTVQKPATSTTTADRTSQRPITKERPSTVQRVPLQNTRSRPPIKTATIKKVGKKP